MTSEWNACWQTARRINGWLTAREGRFLFEAARAVPAGGRIVEIGSFFGRSTVCLALGSRAGQSAEVVSVDLHIGSPKHEHLLQCTDTWAHLVANLEQCGVDDLVTVIKGDSVEVARTQREPIDFLFVDGAHEQEYVAADLEHWFPLLREDARIAFHDSWHMSGVRRVTSGLLATSSNVVSPRLVDTITVARKVDASTSWQRLANRVFLGGRLVRGLAGFLRLTYLGTRLGPASAQPGADRLSQNQT